MTVPEKPPTTKQSDDSLAAELAAGAGDLLLGIRQQGELEGKALGAAGDAAAHRWIADVLATRRPEDALLSEEGAQDAARLAHRRVWVVDPLDGTREYSEGRADWAVHICLTTDGVPTASAVRLPAMGVTYGTDAALELPPAQPEPLRILVSRSRPPEIATRVADRLGAELVPMGSAGAKAMAVLRGEAHAYVHAGGQYEWDSAAPAGVALAAGLHVSRLDGSPLRYNRPDPLLPDLVICHPRYAPALMEAIALESTLIGEGGR